jgi:hypothetical protein
MILLPPIILAVSSAVGTLPPTQVEPWFQFPPVERLVTTVAEAIWLRINPRKEIESSFENMFGLVVWLNKVRI